MTRQIQMMICHYTVCTFNKSDPETNVQKTACTVILRCNLIQSKRELAKVIYIIFQIHTARVKEDIISYEIFLILA